MTPDNAHTRVRLLNFHHSPLEVLVGVNDQTLYTLIMLARTHVMSGWVIKNNTKVSESRRGTELLILLIFSEVISQLMSLELIYHHDKTETRTVHAWRL